MPKSEIPSISKEIANRFYLATEHLQSTKQIRGLGTLAKEWNVSRFSMSWSKNHPDDKRIKVEYLYYIARDYNISLDWLFFGKGDMQR